MIGSMSVHRKINLGFGLLIVLSLIGALLGRYESEKLAGYAQGLAEEWMPKVAKLGEVTASLSQFRAIQYEALSQSDLKARAEILEAADGEKGNIFIYLKTYTALPLGPAETEQVEAFQNDWQSYLNLHQELLEILKDPAKNRQAMDSLTASAELHAKLVKEVDSLNQIAFDGGLAASEKAQTASTEGSRLGLAVLGLSFGLGVVLAIVIGRNIRRVLAAVVSGMSGISDDLSQNAQTLNRTSDKMASDVSVSASSLQETSSSLEQVSSMVALTDQHSRQAIQTTEECDRMVVEGRQAMTEMVRSIESLKGSTEKLTEDVTRSNQKVSELGRIMDEIRSKAKVINEIVFQTKLLSFNASVEAERAGENGKGFAVVAQEIGSLAQMSGKAAQEIETLLVQSTDEVARIAAEVRSTTEQALGSNRANMERGVQLAQSCQDVLEKIASLTQAISLGSREVSRASSEQNIGVRGITDAISHLNGNVQENAQSSQNLSQMSEQILTQADELRSYIAQLQKIIGQQGAGRAGPASKVG